MPLLEVQNVKKIYTSKLGTAQVQALSDISFSVEAGEYIAIMGESGSGKTTLLNILASLDKPTSGEVLLDGKDLTKISDKHISAFRRDNLGFVFQDFNLLDTFNVADNIYLPLVLSKEPYALMKPKLEKLARPLGIDHLLEKYPYEISGGQKQRLAIARAIAKNPDIYIFDDSFSALDFKTDAKLRQELNQLVKKTKSTVLLVGQRIASIMDADQIIVLDEGRIVGKGTHEELMKSCQVYQEIAYSQLSKEELSHE